MRERVRTWIKRVDLGMVLACLLPAFAVQPLLQPGLPGAADAVIHLFRAADFLNVLRDGVLVPRWAPNLAYGYGYPLFVFAPPLPYYVMAAFHLFGLTLEGAMKLMVISTFVAYSLGMYLFARAILGPGAALLAAAAYVYTPFRMREAYIYGGNYPQFMAIAAFPWVLWAFHQLIATGGRRYVLVGALTCSVLILSHIFHASVLVLVLGAYVLLAMILSRQFNRLAPVVASGLLGLGLTAFFWLPVLDETQWVRANAEAYVALSDFHTRFVSQEQLLGLPVPLDASAANPLMPMSLGPVIVALSAAAVLTAGISSLTSQASDKSQALTSDLFATSLRPVTWVMFFATVLLVTVFMMTPDSVWLWERIPPLPIAQYPWRLMGVANLASAFLAGAALAVWRDLGVRGPAVLVAAIAVVILAVAPYLYPPKPFVQYGEPTLADVISYEVRSQVIGMTTLGEYLPIWAQVRPADSPMVADYLAARPINKLDVTALSSDIEWQVTAHTATRDAFRFASPRPFTARLRTFYYPGWQAEIDGKPAPIRIEPPLGLITVDVPAGTHELVVRFTDTPLRAAANAVSLLAVILAVCLLLWGLLSGLRSQVSGQVISRQRSAVSGQRSWDVRRRTWDIGQEFAWVGAALSAALLFKVAVIDTHTTWFRAASPPGQVFNVQHSLRANLDNQVTLLGYDIGSDQVTQGSSLWLRLYWQARRPIGKDYSVFVHLDGPWDQATYAQSNAYHPGDPVVQGEIPTSTWDTTHYVRDEHRLHVPADVPPVAYTLRVGLWDAQTGQRLPVLADDGSVAGDAVALQTVHVMRREPLTIANPLTVNFGPIELVGYRLETRTGEIDAALYWRATAPVPKDYTVFAHVVDSQGRLVAQNDSQPMQGMYATSLWRPGETVEDRRVISVSPGTYRLVVGLYELATLQRLPATDGRGRLPDDAFNLPVSIEIK